MPTYREYRAERGDKPRERDPAAPTLTYEEYLAERGLSMPAERAEAPVAEEGGDFFGRRTLGQLAALASYNVDPTRGGAGVAQLGRGVLERLGFEGEDERQRLAVEGTANVASLAAGGAVAGRIAAPMAAKLGTGMLARAGTGAVAGGVSGATEGFVQTTVLGEDPATVWEETRNRALFGAGLGGMFSFLAGGVSAGMRRAKSRLRKAPTVEDMFNLTEASRNIEETIGSQLGKARSAAERKLWRRGLAKIEATLEKEAAKRGDELLPWERGIGFHNADEVMQRVRAEVAKTPLTPIQVRKITKALGTAEDLVLKKFSTDQAKVLPGLRKLASDGLFSVGEALRRDARFGTIGPVAARLIELKQQVADLFVGHADEYMKDALRGLSKAQRIEAAKAIHGLVPKSGLSKAQRRFVRKWEAFAEKVADTAEAMELRVFDPLFKRTRVFQRRRGWAPRFYAPDMQKQYLDPASPSFRKLSETIREEGRRHGLRLTDGDIAKEIRSLLDEDAFVKPMDVRAPSLQFVRNFDMPGFEMDPIHWWHKYSRISGDRLAFGKLFGSADQLKRGLVEQLKSEAGDHRTLAAILDYAGGKMPETPAITKLMRNYVSLGLLGPKTGILQLTQIVPAYSEFGLKSLARATFRSMTDPTARRLIGRSGALIPSAIDPELGGIGWTRRWFTATGVRPVDKVVRANFGAMGGMMHVQDIAARYAKGRLTGGEVAQFARGLKRLGLDPEEVFRLNGQLTDGHILVAAREGARITQFTSELADLPLYTNTQVGRWVYSLRKFALQFHKHIVNNVIAEALKGNFRPAMRLGFAAPIAAEGVLYARSKVMGSEDYEPQLYPFLEEAFEGKLPSNWVTVLANSLTVGMFGVIGDIARQMLENPASAGTIVAGPGVGVATETAGELLGGTLGTGVLYGDEPELDEERLLNLLLRRTPLVGPSLGQPGRDWILERVLR